MKVIQGKIEYERGNYKGVYPYFKIILQNGKAVLVDELLSHFVGDKVVMVFDDKLGEFDG